MLASEGSSNQNLFANNFSEQEDLEAAMNLFTNSIKIVVPEGMVVGVNPENMQTVTWQYKVSSVLKGDCSDLEIQYMQYRIYPDIRRDFCPSRMTSSVL